MCIRYAYLSHTTSCVCIPETACSSFMRSALEVTSILYSSPCLYRITHTEAHTHTHTHARVHTHRIVFHVVHCTVFMSSSLSLIPLYYTAWPCVLICALQFETMSAATKYTGLYLPKPNIGQLRPAKGINRL